MKAPAGFSGIDLNLVPPEERHELVRCSFGLLDPGQGLRISLDHDPKPLRSQLQKLWPNTFSWDYVSAGPERWVVDLKKKKLGKKNFKV